MKYLKKFPNHEGYSAYSASTEFVLHNVSICVTEEHVHYDPQTLPPVIHVTGVSLSESAITLTTGATTALTATVTPDDATDKRVVWTSNDPSVATVDSSGVVTAIGVGDAIITVTTRDRSFTAQCSVTVEATPIVHVTSVTLSESAMTLEAGMTSGLTATVEPDNATDKSVTWSSSDETIATVNASGVVTAVAVGEATITVTTTDGSHTDTCVVTVTPATLDIIYGATEKLNVDPNRFPIAIQEETFDESTGIGVIKFDGVLEEIGYYAFGGETGLTSIKIPSTVKRIVGSSFESCTNLESISLPNSITEIGWGTFYGCTSLTSVTIPNGVTVIDGNLFNGCTSLTNVTMPSGATSIGGSAFEGCTSMINITIPSNVNTIDDYAFSNCTGLTGITCESLTPPSLGYNALNNGNNCPIYVPCEAYDTYLKNYDWYSYRDRLQCFGPVIQVTGVSLADSAMTIYVGFTKALKANVLPPNATYKGVTWSSSDPSIATVSAGGVVSGISEGTATITVTTNEGGYTAQCLTTVETGGTRVTGVTVSPTWAIIKPGETQQLTPTVFPPDATDKSVFWNIPSHSSSYASVDENGLVTGLQESDSPIDVYCRTNDGYKQASAAIMVTNDELKPVTSITLNESSVEIFVNESITGLYANVQPWDATFRYSVVEMTTDPTIVARVYDPTTYTNNYKGLAPGEADIIYYAIENPSVSAVCHVTVKEGSVPVTGITVYPTSINSEPGNNWVVTATVLPNNATNKKVIWTSSDPTVAEYVTTGGSPSIKTIAPGNAVISAVTEDGGYLATVNVTVFAPVVGNITYVSASKLDINPFYMSPTGFTEVYNQDTGIGIIENVNTVRESAIQGRTDLTEITFPQEVTSIGAFALAGCSSLNSITINRTTPPSLGNAAFDNTNNCPIYVPCESVWDYRETWETYADRITCSGPIPPKPGSVTGVTLNEHSITIFEGFVSDAISATVSPDDAIDKTVKWTSSDSTVADITGHEWGSVMSKVISGLTPGNADIIVTTHDGEYVDTCHVTVVTAVTYTAESQLNITASSFTPSMIAHTFNPETGVGSMAFDGNLTEIKDGAFFMTSLTSINLPNTVTSIGKQAFENCHYLTNLDIPDSVTSIGERAFVNCNGFTDVNIPSGITEIPNSLFEGCYYLTAVTIPSGVTSIGEKAFFNTQITGVDVPTGVTSIGEYAFANSKVGSVGPVGSGADVEIPTGITSLSKGLFSATEVSSLEIPSYVTEIGEECFRATNLSGELIIPSTVSVGQLAFANCRSLTSAVIPSTFTEIPRGLFDGCTSITGVTLPNTITKIGAGAFGMTAISKFVIDDNVTEIGTIAFYGTNITSVGPVGSGADIEIPDRFTEVDWFSGCKSLTSVTLDNNVTTVGFEGFKNCSALTSVTMGNNVRYIEGRAFLNCSALTSVTINTVYPPDLGGEDDAFDNTNNCPIYVPSEAVRSYKLFSDFKKYADRIFPIT